jgi:hypothetical protein
MEIRAEQGWRLNQVEPHPPKNGTGPNDARDLSRKYIALGSLVPLRGMPPIAI